MLFCLRSSGFANARASDNRAAFPLPILHSWKSLRLSSSGGIIRGCDGDVCLVCFKGKSSLRIVVFKIRKNDSPLVGVGVAVMRRDQGAEQV